VIVFSAFLVVVAVGLLIAGVVASKLWLVYVAIGVSGVSLLALGLGAIIRRGELFGRRQEAEPARPQPVAAQVPSAHDHLEGFPPPAAAPAGYDWSAAAQPGPRTPGYLPSDHPSTIRPPAAQPSPAWGAGVPPAASFPPAAPPGRPAEWEHPPAASPSAAPAASVPTVPSAPLVPTAPAEPVTGVTPLDDQPPAEDHRLTETQPPAESEPALLPAESLLPGPAEPTTTEPTTTEPTTTEPTTTEPTTTEPAAAEPGAEVHGAPDEATHQPAPEPVQPAQDELPTAGEQPPPDSVPPADGGAEPLPAEVDLLRQVTVVPGVPRYHNAQCILIRFMGEDDLNRMTLGEARQAGCTPCRACQPDQP
jgi:hypothetical protein